MENTKELDQERERLNVLEKRLARAGKFFSAAVLTTIVTSFNLYSKVPEPSTYDVIALLGCVPLSFGTWLYAMSHKTEEYCRLAQKFYYNRES